MTIVTKVGTKASVPCGQCISCRINRRREWVTRLDAESKLHLYTIFATLTYDEEHNPGTVLRCDLQTFFKRLRKHGFVFRYFASAEYGEDNDRPHYHVLFFCDIEPSTENHWLFQKIWANGIIDGFTPALPEQVRYCVKYTTKHLTGTFGDEYYISRNQEPEFFLMSRRPGIGANFFSREKDNIMARGDWMPPYYVRKEELVYKKKGSDKIDTILTYSDKKQYYKNLLAKQGKKKGVL